MKKINLFILILAFGFDSFAQIKGATPIADVSGQSSGDRNTYVVVVGISDYQDKDIPDLLFADKDAETFANFLRSPAGGALDGDHIQVLTNSQATAGRIAEALDALIEKSKKDDQVIIYFSGHGDVEGKKLTQPGFLLCWDSPSRVYMGGGTYSLSFLQEVVSTLSVQNQAKVVVITDACHAGKLAGSQIGGAQLTTANLAKQYANEVKILSCQPNEFSLEGEQWGGGRGVFSYHLVDGLLGLADRNNDGQVTLGEIDRYLEDHVTEEASPQSQVPILLGNKTDKLATVNSKILNELKKNKIGNMLVMGSTESRGFEEDVLTKTDTLIRNNYFAFKKAVHEKRFFFPAIDCAEKYYTQLEKDESIASLRGIMKRNYAAALQDDAQQAMNIWLKADVQQLECIGKSLKLESIPKQLNRAAELLGDGHYMYQSLKARRLLFEGIIKMKHQNPDEVLGRECLSLFRQSLAIEPQSPLPWHRMCQVYVSNLRQPDSAFICARQARSLASNWVLPFADLGYKLIQQNKFELAKLALEEAEAIDSLHPYVINRWANWLTFSGGRANLEKAEVLFEKYQESGGPTYPCWFNDYANVLKYLGRFSESEEKFNQGISLDSTQNSLWINLGVLYIDTRNYAKAEYFLKKAIGLDSTTSSAWDNLGKVYKLTGRYAEAEQNLKKAIALDSSFATHWGNLGALYNQTGRYVEAETFLKKAIALDSSFAVHFNNLGNSYIQTRRYIEAESVIKKAIALDSTVAAPWVNLGNLYILTRRYTEAEPVIKKAIVLDSTMANPRKHLGMIYFKTNRLDEARKNFLKAIELNPNYAAALLGIAYLFAAEGKTVEAIGYVEQAIKKGRTFEQLQNDEDLAPLRDQKEQWDALMRKSFPDYIKK